MTIAEPDTGNRIELLAPAGQMESLRAVVEAGCDAVYLGGKSFNMRMLRSAFNFSDQELSEARAYTTGAGVKMYVTVNNLYSDASLTGLESYLVFLQDLGADALIVQDLAVVKMHRDMNLSIPLHASVQMGINNLESVRLLEDLGFERVILSKNLSLDEIRFIKDNSSIGIEYFVHGDLCVSHTGQCYMSSFAFGESGNQGRCRKPCRWPYRLAGPGMDSGHVSDNGSGQDYKFYLAHNDLCLYPKLKELIDSGVTSLKIEGRMREAEYVSFLVRTYRRGLDALVEGGTSWERVRDEGIQVLQERRVRDFTGGSVSGCPAPDSIGLDGRREPRFFSKATPIRALDQKDYDQEEGRRLLSVQAARPLALQVKLGSFAGLERILEAGARQLVFDWGSHFEESKELSVEEMLAAGDMCRQYEAALILEMPRLGHRFDYARLDAFANILRLSGISRVIVHDPGMLRHIAGWGLEIQGGYGLNISNQAAARFWMDMGLAMADLSLELKIPEMDFAAGFNSGLVVHGPLCGLIADIWPGSEAGKARGAEASPEAGGLIDELGQLYPLRRDAAGRAYLHYAGDLCLFPWLPELAGRGIKYVRIAGEMYDEAHLARLVEIYRGALDELATGSWEQRSAFERLLNMGDRPLTSAAFATDLNISG